jgi:hypothetical protein
MNWSIRLDWVVLGINLDRNDEENHGVFKDPIGEQWGVTLHEVELYVVKWCYSRLMYILWMKWF